MNELTTTSGTLTAAQQYAYRLDYEIKAEAQKVVNSICCIGRCLKEMKEHQLYEQLGCSSFEEYAEKAVGLKKRAAYNYISAYETYGENGLEKYGSLGITKLAALAQLNDADREEMLDSGKAEEMSVRELKAEIEHLKNRNEQLTFELEDISSSAGNADELETARAEIELLKAALENERKKAPPVPQMSDEEREEIRKNIEVEQEMRHNEEIKEAVDKTTEKVKEEYKELLSHETKKTAAVKKDLKAAEERINANVEQINQLNKKLAKANEENARLQANAQKAPPSGNKELLKFLMKNIVEDFNKAAELVKNFPEEEQESCKQALKKVSQAIKEAGENL